VVRFRIIVLTLVALLGSIPAASAQNTGDAAALSDRLDRMQRDLDALQRQVYQGNPPPAAATGQAPAASGPLALQDEDRMTRLEDQMRDLNGKVETLNNAISQLGARLDKLSSDVDMRLTALEHGAVPAGANAPPVASGAAPAAAATSANAPATTPNAQYEAAFALLRRADYPGAEQALRAFVTQHPRDPLAGNAQYWLGETFYVRKNWKDAAIAFAEGYQKYPKSGKAPDDLLKLAMSLGNMGQKADACTALRHLDHDFPRMPANVRGPAAAAKQHLGC